MPGYSQLSFSWYARLQDCTSWSPRKLAAHTWHIFYRLAERWGIYDKLSNKENLGKGTHVPWHGSLPAFDPWQGFELQLQSICPLSFDQKLHTWPLASVPSLTPTPSLALIVPYHLWSPRVCKSSPTPVTPTSCCLLCSLCRLALTTEAHSPWQPRTSPQCPIPSLIDC